MMTDDVDDNLQNSDNNDDTSLKFLQMIFLISDVSHYIYIW